MNGIRPMCNRNSRTVKCLTNLLLSLKKKVVVIGMDNKTQNLITVQNLKVVNPVIITNMIFIIPFKNLLLCYGIVGIGNVLNTTNKSWENTKHYHLKFTGNPVNIDITNRTVINFFKTCAYYFISFRIHD